MPTAKINGAELFYHDEGSGQVLLLVHAFPLNSAMWEPQIATFASRLRVIAPDLPGFGRSELGQRSITLDVYADTLVALLEHVGVERAAVVGLSMGGYTSFALLRRYPNWVSALVLADTKAKADTDEAKAKRAENAQIALELGQDAIADRMLPTLLSPNASERLQAQAREIIRTNSREGIAAALHAMASRPDSTSLLADIAIPTVIIVGENDTLTPPDEAREMSAQIGDSRISVIPNAGHLSNLEQPEAFDAAVSALYAVPKTLTAARSADENFGQGGGGGGGW